MRDSSQRLNAVLNWNLQQLDWADYDLLRQIVGQGIAAGRSRVTAASSACTPIPGDDESLALRPDSTDEEAADALLDREGRLALSGHTHLALDREVGNWRVINPGSVGLSCRESRARRSGRCWNGSQGALHGGLAARALTMYRRRWRAWQALGYPEIEWIAQRLRG